jgi:hypothetical protein
VALFRRADKRSVIRRPARKKKALLFEKRSKNFSTAVADYSATEAQKFFGSFFQKRTLALSVGI